LSYNTNFRPIFDYSKKNIYFLYIFATISKYRKLFPICNILSIVYLLKYEIYDHFINMNTSAIFLYFVKFKEKMVKLSNLKDRHHQNAEIRVNLRIILFDNVIRIYSIVIIFLNAEKYSQNFGIYGKLVIMKHILPVLPVELFLSNKKFLATKFTQNFSFKNEDSI